MTAPHDSHGDRDFRQLTGAFDRPIAPSPRFTEALKQRVEEETAMQQSSTAPIAPISRRTARTRASLIETRRRWFDVAIAAVLIVGILASTYWYADIRIGTNGPTDPQSTRYAAQPLSRTPGASDSMLPGDPGHSSSWPYEFDISQPIVAQELDGYAGYGASATIIGDVLIAENKRLTHEDPATYSGTGIYAQDLTTGEILWRNTDQVHQRYTGDASGAYILPQRFSNAQHLVALDLETGEERWTSEPLSTFSSYDDTVPFLHAGTPIVIDAIVYVPFVDGSVVAFDGPTGDVVWRYTPETTASIDDVNGNVSISATSDHIYATSGNNTISVLDHHDGSLVREIALADFPASDYWIQLHIRDSHLIVQARALRSDGPDSYLVGVDSDSGEQLWSQKIGVIQSNVLVTPNRVGVVHAIFDDPSIIERIFTDTQPEGTLVFSLFDLGTGEPIEVPDGVLTPIAGVWSAALAASGETVCLSYTTVTCFDKSGNLVPIDGYETPHLTTIGQELLFWDNNLVIVSPLVPTHKTAAPATSPVAAIQNETEPRGGNFGSTSDRSLVNPDLDGPTDPLTLAWTHVVSDPLWAMPYNDVVASLGTSEIAVHNATTGEMLWSKSTTDAFSNETYDTDRDPKFLLGQRQGQQVALPWIVGDTMYYAGTTDLIGVNVYTGNEVFRTAHTVVDETMSLDLLFFPSEMAAKDGTAYVLTRPTRGFYVLKAIDLTSGDVLWSYEAGEPADDWRDISTWLFQPVVTDDLVVLQVWSEESTILALNASDGTVAWEQPESLVEGADDNSYSNISAIENDFLVMTRRGAPTGTVDGTPNVSQSLQVALYDLRDGSLLWTDTEGTFPNQESGLCRVVPGWDETSLYIPCSTDSALTMFRYPFDGNGDVERLGTWQTSGPATANIYDARAAYFNTGTSIFRVDLASGETSSIPLQGGESCIGLQATDDTVLCIHDDGLGTYSIQAYASSTSIATPQASPAGYDPALTGIDITEPIP